MPSKAGHVAKLRMRQKRLTARSALMGTLGGEARRVGGAGAEGGRGGHSSSGLQGRGASGQGQGVGIGSGQERAGAGEGLGSAAGAAGNLQTQEQQESLAPRGSTGAPPKGPHTVLTKVIIDTPWASVMVTALVDGSMARAVTGTDGTAVHCHSGLAGLLWILRGGEWWRQAVRNRRARGTHAWGRVAGRREARAAVLNALTRRRPASTPPPHPGPPEPPPPLPRAHLKFAVQEKASREVAMSMTRGLDWLPKLGGS
jgi:hypothetical protein